MNRLAQITTLAASIDTTLTRFAGLMPNEAGEMPWQAAQRQKRNRRIAGAAVGTAAIGAGVYGVNKLKGAMNTRYGTQGMDGMKAGAADLVNRADDAMKAGVQKVKTVAAPMIDKARTMTAPVMGAMKRKVAAGKLSYGRGVAQRQGMGKLVGRVARAVIHASRADQIIALEAKIDGALAEFGLGLSAGMKMLQPKPSLMAPKASVGVLNPKAESALLVPKLSVGVSKPKSPSLPTKKRKFWGGRDVTDNPNFG